MNPESKYKYTKLSINLPPGEEGKKFYRAIRIAAAHQDLSVTKYCLEAVKQRLIDEGFLQPS